MTPTLYELGTLQEYEAVLLRVSENHPDPDVRAIAVVALQDNRAKQEICAACKWGRWAFFTCVAVGSAVAGTIAFFKTVPALLRP
jgi:hypothetical protein